MLFPEQLWQWLAWSAPNAALHTREEPRCCGERRVGPLGLLFLALPFLWESGGKCLAILLYFCCTALQQSPEVSIKIELTVSGNGCCHVSERSTRGDTAKQKPPRWGGAGEGSSKKKRKLLVEQRELAGVHLKSMLKALYSGAYYLKDGCFSLVLESRPGISGNTEHTSCLLIFESSRPPWPRNRDRFWLSRRKTRSDINGN